MKHQKHHLLKSLKTFENEREVKLEEQKEEAPKGDEKEKELENYSKDVQRRIAKLTT